MRSDFNKDHFSLKLGFAGRLVFLDLILHFVGLGLVLELYKARLLHLLIIIILSALAFQAVLAESVFRPGICFWLRIEFLRSSLRLETFFWSEPSHHPQNFAPIYTFLTGSRDQK